MKTSLCNYGRIRYWICLIAALGILIAVRGTSVAAVAASTPLSQDSASPSAATSSTISDSSDSTSDSTAQPTTPKRKSYPWIGPEIGTFLPTSSKVQDRFGSSWTAISLGIGHITQPSDHNAFVIDYNALYNKAGKDFAFIAPIGVEYQQFLGRCEKANPYVGASADMVFTDVRSDEDNVKAGLRIVPGGSAFAGVSFGRRAFLEARYTLVADVKGFDFSGTNLTLGFRF